MQKSLLRSRSVNRRLLWGRLGVLGLLAVLCLAVAPGFAQDENTDLWRIQGDPRVAPTGTPYDVPAGTGPWHGDSLYVGATFLRDTTKEFIVWLAPYYIPQGSYHGALYLMVPQGTGIPDSAYFLFWNKCQPNPNAPTRIDLTNIPFIAQNIHHLDTLFFMYRSSQTGAGGTTCPANYGVLTNDFGVTQNDSLFTGPNRARTDVPPWNNFDRHYSARNENALAALIANSNGAIPNHLIPPAGVAGIPDQNFVPDTFWSISKQKYVKYGRRWCEAAWVHTRIGGNVRTDTVEFGFEDQFNGLDLHFEDIRFNVSGVFLIHPVILDSLALNLFSSDTIRAGDSAVGKAVISGRDSTGRLFTDSTNLASGVVWGLVKSSQSLSNLSKGNGPSSTNVFRAVTAYEWDTITVRYTDPKSGKMLNARKAVYVAPGPAYKVWIEPDTLINVNDRSAASLVRLRNPDHLALVTISGSQTQATAYSVVRDLYGNFVSLATTAAWAEYAIPPATPPGYVTVTTPVKPYVGLITRVNTQTVSSYVKSSETGLIFDTTRVSLLNGVFTQLRFINAITGDTVTSISMNTDSSIQLKLVGILSSDPVPNHWIDATGLWSLTPNIASDFPIPATAPSQTWTFSPQVPGGPSSLVATNGTATVSIPVTVTPAPPDSVSISIITPLTSLTAGQPFQAEVRVYNHDGLVPGTYCYPTNSGTSAIYQDSLGKGTTPDPTVVTKSGNGIINQAPGTTNTVQECFTGGIDTVTLTLYRAPYNNAATPKDTTHQITVVLGPHSAITVPFTLQPGPLSRLQIENVNNVHVVGPDTLRYPSGSTTLFSIGYDQWGNRRGREASNWGTSNNLEPPSQVNMVSQVYLSASDVTSDESGILHARAARFVNGVFQDSLAADSLPIVILGPPSSLDSAVTRDVNGDGYLDEMHAPPSKKNHNKVIIRLNTLVYPRIQEGNRSMCS